VEIDKMKKLKTVGVLAMPTVLFFVEVPHRFRELHALGSFWDANIHPKPHQPIRT
jgi:hypothetical protein